MSYINNYLKKDYMNKTIGLILCKEGDKIVVNFIEDDRLLVSTYLTNKI